MKKQLIIALLILSALFTLFSCLSREYAVTFDSKDGTYVESQIIEKNGYVIKPEAPTKEGYTFKGWHYNNSEWSFLADKVQNNMVLTAKWEKNKYTVSFDANGGSSDTKKSALHGEKITAPMVSRPNYSFIGWFNGDTQWSFNTDTVTSNITLTAKWEGFSKTIKFNVTDGTVSETERKVHYGDAIGALPVPTNGNSVFLGWYDSDDINMKNQITKDYTVTSDMILVPKWKNEASQPDTDTDGACNHIFSLWAEFTPATCDKAQVLYHICTECGLTEYQDGTAAQGHSWSVWREEQEATCTKQQIDVRSCLSCGISEQKNGRGPLGHDISQWDYDLMSQSGYCLSCKSTIKYDYENLSSKIKDTSIEGAVLGAENVNCLFNGNWDETGGTFCGRGGSVAVNIELTEATYVDLIQIKGKGGYTYNLFVLYEGESEYTMVGMGAFGDTATKFDINKKITKISIQMDNGGYLDGYWQEVAIVKIPEVF